MTDAAGPAVWFRLAVGREDGAEVRHVLPMICRRTGLSKRDVGTIRIGARETLFAVTPAVAGQVANAAAQSAPHDVAISSADGVPAEPQRRRFQDAPKRPQPKRAFHADDRRKRG